MAFIENSALRQPNSVTFEDSVTGIRRLVSSIAPLHYQDANGDYQRIDMAPTRINPGDWSRYPGFDGWLVQANGYLFGLGVDGWVYFGGRRGEHYVRFRLASGGYYDTAAKQWHAIAATPTYSTANLTRNTVTTQIEGVAYHTKTVAEWRNLFTTPGGGEVWLRFVVTGGRLKSEYVMNQAARAWITANRPPSFFGISPANAQFGFRFEMDWSDIPTRKVAGALVGNEFDDSAGGVELRNALDELLAFMPVDSIYVEQAALPLRAALPQRKRFVGDALYMGAPVTQIAALPAGDLIFDPTITPSVAASGDDWTWINGVGFGNTETGLITGYYLSTYLSHSATRYLSVAIPAGSTIITAYATFIAATSYTNTMSALQVAFADLDNAGAATDATSAEAQTQTTAKTSWTPGNHTAGTSYNTPSVVSSLQEVIDRAGWASGNALVLVIKAITASNNYRSLASWDHATYAAPVLTIDYGTDHALAGSTTMAFSGTGTLTTGTAHALAGSTSVDFSQSGALTAGLALAGSASIDFSGTGALTTSIAHALEGSTSVDFSGSAGLTAGLSLAGSTSVDFSGTGTLTIGVPHALEGSASIDFSGSGALTINTAHALAGSATITFSGTGRLYTPVLQFLIELDTLRDGSYGGTHDDITAFMKQFNWRNGMSDSYQEVAPPARAQFRVDNSGGEWRQEWRGSEVLTNGSFASWTSDNPNNWTVTGESGSNPYANQTGQSELHGGTGTGCCNLYTTSATLSISQAVLTIGTRYEVVIEVDTIDETLAGGFYVKCGSTTVSKLYHLPGTKTLTFTADSTTFKIETFGAVDVTLSSVSVKAVKRYCGTLNKGTLIRIRAQAPGGSMTTLYTGQVVNAPTDLGEWGAREFTITAECPMQRLLDLEYQPSLMLNTTADAVISEIFDEGKLPYPYAYMYWMLDVEGCSILDVTARLYGHSVTDFDTGNTVLPFTGDSENETGNGTSAQGVIRSVMAAEMGRFFFDTRTGQFKLHNRMRDVENNTAADSLTFSDFLTPETADDDVKNHVTLNYEPRAVGTAGEVIWTLSGLPLRLDAGVRKELSARYSDPDSEKPMGAMDFISPVAGLDYSVTTDEEGSGADVTSKVTVAVEFGGSSAKVWLDSSQTCYVQNLRLRGTPLRRYDRQAVTAASGDSFYGNEQQYLVVDIPAVSDPDYAQGIANLLLGRYSDKTTRLRAVNFVMGYGATTAAERVINRVIGDRVSISDAWSQHDQDYFIVGEEHQYVAGSAMLWKTRWILRPASREIYWILDVPGYMELGTTTRLAL